MRNGKWGMGNEEWEMRNRKWGMGNEEWGMGNGKWKIKNGEWGMGYEMENEIFPISVLDLFFIVRKRYFFIDIQVFLPKHSGAKSNEWNKLMTRKKVSFKCFLSFIYFATHEKKVYEQLTVFCTGCFPLSFLWCDFINKHKFSFFYNNHKMLSHLKPNLKQRIIAVDIRFENWGVSVGYYPHIFPSLSWGILAKVMCLDNPCRNKNIWWIIIKGIPCVIFSNYQALRTLR